MSDLVKSGQLEFIGKLLCNNLVEAHDCYRVDRGNWVIPTISICFTAT